MLTFLVFYNFLFSLRFHKLMYFIYYRENITGLPYETGLLQINLNLPIIHAWIHVLKHLEQIAYFFNARHAFIDSWPIQGLCGPKPNRSPEQKKREKDALKDAKQEFQDKASNPEGLNRHSDPKLRIPFRNCFGKKP